MALFWMPPFTSYGKTTTQRLEELEKYVQQMTEQLSIVLADLGEDNLGPELQDAIYSQNKEG